MAPQWQRGPDPPDWWVDLDGTRFAAEVTRVFGNINPAGHSGYRPAEEQRKFACKLCSEIRSLIASIPESGSYYIHIQAMMISDLERAAVLVQTREYVLRHLLDSQAAAEVIFKKEGAGTYAAISIEKKTNKGAGAGCSYSSQRLPVAGEAIERELYDIVTSAIRSKTSRLAKANIQEPKILMIVDAYLLARTSFWEELQVDFGPFSSVFLVSPNGYCQPFSERS
jgi:hypothetical protein